MAAADSAASVPMVIIRVTPAARAASIGEAPDSVTVGPEPSRPSKVRWQWLSAHTAGPQSVIRGKSGSPRSTVNPPG